MITNRSQNQSVPVRSGFPSFDCLLPRRTGGFGYLKKPPNNLYVCSFHFVDKKPTAENPYPTLWLGYYRPPEKKRRKLQRKDTSTVSTGVIKINARGQYIHRYYPSKYIYIYFFFERSRLCSQGFHLFN